MINPIKFDTAKLLKEKGFNDHFYPISQEGFNRWVMCKNCYDPNDETKSLQTWTDNIDCSTQKRLERLISAPIIAQVIMWLHEKHGIWIYTETNCYGEEWYSKISVASREVWEDLDKRSKIMSVFRNFDSIHKSSTEAYEAAIIHTLNKII